MKHILIVEDQWTLYNDMAEFFTENGFSVSDYANSYTEAMTCIAKKKPDIALLDIDIDGSLNGIQVGQQLNETLGIPLVYISGLIDKDVLEAAKKTNPNTYLIKSKNADLNQMLITVEMALINSKKDKEHPEEQMTAKGFFVYEDYIKTLRKTQRDIERKTITFDQVQYIMTNPDQVNGKGYLVFCTNDGKQYFQRNTITALTEQLKKQSQFEIISQSHIINIEFITGTVNNRRIKIGKTILKISEKYLDKIINIIKNLFL